MGLYVDSLSLIPAFLSSLFTALALTYNVYYLSPYNRAYEIGWGFNRSYSFILLFNGAMLGTLFSDNLLSLLIFWELISICSYVLISFWNEDRFSLWAAFKCFIMTHIGSLALLMATIIIYFSAGTLKISELGQTIPLEDPMISIIFPLILIAALPKTVLFPLHTWLPDGTVAPTSTILVFHEGGTLAGVYMFLRFFLDVFRAHMASATLMPLPSIFGNVSVWGFIISLIGAATIIIGALNGLVENDIKRIVAYGSISGLSYTAIAVGLITPLGSIASLFLMVSHALCFGLLFLCVGAMIYATGKHNINEMGGLYQSMPITAFCCLIGIFAWSTVPLLSEFAGKYLLFHAAINAQATLFTAIAFLGCVLNVAVATRLLHSVFMQMMEKPHLKFSIRDPPIFMLAPMILVSVALIVFGVAPMVPLNLLVIPAVEQIGLSIDIISQVELIKTPLGFWNPPAIAIAIFMLLTIFIITILYSRRVAAVYRRQRSEETFNPFLCGEDLGLLNGPSGYHFYYTLTNILGVEKVCHASNADRAYYKLSEKFYLLCVKISRLDIRQQYFPAVFLFVMGAAILILIAFLAG
jgi:multicomponent Na+:H+ antiporter subunit A